MNASDLTSLCDTLLYRASSPSTVMDRLTDLQREELGLAALREFGSAETLDEVKDVDLYSYYESEIIDRFESLYTIFDYSGRDEND